MGLCLLLMLGCSWIMPPVVRPFSPPTRTETPKQRAMGYILRKKAPIIVKIELRETLKQRRSFFDWLFGLFGAEWYPYTGKDSIRVRLWCDGEDWTFYRGDEAYAFWKHMAAQGVACKLPIG